MSSRGAQVGKKVGLGFIETVIHVCVYILIIFLLIRVAAWGYDFSYQVFGDPVMSEYNTETVKFTVRNGQTAADVAEGLENAKLIKYSMAFRIRAKLEKLENSIVPGTYELSQAMTADEILVKMTSNYVEKSNDSSALLGENASGTISETEAETESGSDGETTGE